MAIYEVDPDENRAPGSKALRKGRASEALACYSLTVNQVDRQPILADDDPAGIIVGSLDYLRKDHHIRLLAFCVMPDHVHFVAYLLEKKSLSQVMKSFGAYTAREINALFGRTGRLWHHDHRCRDDRDIEEHVTYAEYNPVRAGLVERAEDWPYSSAHPECRCVLDLTWYP